MTTTTVEATAIQPPDTTELAVETSIVVRKANELVVDSSETLVAAGEFARCVKTLRHSVADLLDGPIKAAHRAHKEIKGAKNQLDDPLKAAEDVVKGKMGRFQAEQERIRREEEDRLRAAALKEAEEQRIKEAVQLEQQGHDEAAEALIEAPVRPAPVVVPKTTPKVAGVSTRVIWRHRIVNAALIPPEYMMPDEKKIGAHGRSMRESASIPGVEFKAESSVAVSAFGT